MKTRPQAADGFYRHLREWFTAFLPRQRGAADNTITSCRHTWNMLLGYVSQRHHVGVDKVTFAMVDRVTVTGFLEHTQAARSWTASTRNQRLACIRSFFTYAAAAEMNRGVAWGTWRDARGPAVLFRGPVEVNLTFRLPGGQHPAEPLALHVAAGVLGDFRGPAGPLV